VSDTTGAPQLARTPPDEYAAANPLTSARAAAPREATLATSGAPDATAPQPASVRAAIAEHAAARRRWLGTATQVDMTLMLSAPLRATHAIVLIVSARYDAVLL
jgi:hypothetical protein